VFLQDFQGDFSLANTHAHLFGPGAPSTMARLPALTAQLAEVRIGASPLRFAFTGSVVREGPLGAPYDSLALTSPSLNPTNPSVPLTAAFTLAPSESVSRARAAMERLDLNPTVSLPWAFGRFANANLSASWRHDAWLFEGNPLPADLNALGQTLSQTGTRGYPIFDFELGTELSRELGTGDGRVRHSIAPQIDLRAIPFQLMAGTVPPLWLIPSAGQMIYDHSTNLPIAAFVPLPYDEIDMASGLTSPRQRTASAFALTPSTSPGGIAQGMLHVDQRLRTHSGEIARLDVGENFDGNGLESTFATVSMRAGPFHAAGFLDWSDHPLPCLNREGNISFVYAALTSLPPCAPSDRQLRRFTEAWAEAGVNDHRGDGLSLSFVRAIAAGGPQISAPLDLLFAVPLANDDPRWALPDVSQLSVSGNVRIVGGLGAHAGASYQLAAAGPIPGLGLFSQVAAGLSYVSGQRCCTIDVNGVFQPVQADGRLGFAAVFVLLDLGEFAGSTSH